MLLRFAGPRLAREASVDDPLLPVALRAGDRTIGGSLSWRGAGRLAAFEPGSPFAGLSVPRDVEIRRQVIAEPSLDVAERTWAQLDDGTPLITGVRRGAGWVVLVHTTASPEWSNLPLSGLFVDILRRIVGPGRQAAAARSDAATSAAARDARRLRPAGRAAAGTKALVRRGGGRGPWWPGPSARLLRHPRGQAGAQPRPGGRPSRQRSARCRPCVRSDDAGRACRARPAAVAAGASPCCSRWSTSPSAWRCAACSACASAGASAGGRGAAA